MSITINNLFYTYLKKTTNEKLALNDVSLEIKDHSFNAIVGQTGSGKSTLIQHLNALLKGDKGKIVIDDLEIATGKKRIKKIKKIRKKVGVVFQFPEYQLFEDTVEKDVSYGPRNFSLKKEDALKKAHEVLSLVGIDEKYYTRSPFDLSGGEKRRVAIAGILAFDPDILVLDEPTVGLDPQGQKMILELVDKLHKKGYTIIMVTHDMDIVLKYAENVFVMDDGKIVYSGSPIELFKKDPSNYSIEMPQLYYFVNQLNNRGYSIDINQIKDVNDVINIILEKKKWIA